MKVKELMIPVADYVTVDEDATLMDAFLALEEDRQTRRDASHRDMLVRGRDGQITGMLTMVDVFRALEPNYSKLKDTDTDYAMLTREYVAKIFKRYELWTDAIPTLCSRVADLRVGDVAAQPMESEFVDEDDDLEMAIHHYIYDVRQPLLVRGGDRVTGVLRYSDVYELVRKHILACQR